MYLVLEELWRELPQGWVMLRRTPDTVAKDGFIEMHFTGDVNLIKQNNALLRVARAAKDIQGDLYYSEEGSAHYLLDVKYAVALAEAIKEVEHLL